MLHIICNHAEWAPRYWSSPTLSSSLIDIIKSMKMLYTNLVQLKRLLKTGKIFSFGQCHVIHPCIHCLDTTACCCNSVTEKWTESPWCGISAPRWLTESSQYCRTPALLTHVTRIKMWRCVCQLTLKLLSVASSPCPVLTHGLALRVSMRELGYLWGLPLPVIWSTSVHSIMFPVYDEIQVTFVLISVWTHGLALQALVSVVRAVNCELNKFQF